MKYFIRAYTRFSFGNRITRKEFWIAFPFFFVIGFVCAFCDGVFGLGLTEYSDYGVLTIIWAFVGGIPLLSMEVKRLHDTGRSGWWVLIGRIPVVGSIILIIFLCQKSQLKKNDYGPIPEEIVKKYGLKPQHEQDAEFRKYLESFINEGTINDIIERPLPSSEVLFCRKCGFKLPPNINFCNQCGTAVIKET